MFSNLVPKLRLGTQAAKLCFAVLVRQARETEFRGGGSQTEFGNQVVSEEPG
jgi:hypothetical protein